MSFQAMAWASKQRVGGVTGKAILLMLANYADQEGRCIPGQQKLADECECSPRAIREWLAKFEEMGIVRREERRRDDGYRTSDLIILSLSSPAPNASEISPADNSPENGSPENDADLTGTKCRAINRTYQVNRKDVGKARASDPEFEEWYRHYPHKVGRGQAERAFATARKIASLQDLIDGLHRYVATKPAVYAWRNPATWLNGKGWLDAPAPEPIPMPRQSSPPQRPGIVGSAQRILESENHGSESVFGNNGDAQFLPAAGGDG